jgi:site-specific DNA-methyltransferase (adenine-specific)
MKLFNDDCLKVLPTIPDKSIDLILTDPPYGTTQNKWDSIIPFDLMWKELKRIIKDNSAIALFGTEPFSSSLRMSNIINFKYDWYWNKKFITGFLNAKRQPLRCIEIISIFYKNKHKYYPIMIKGKMRKKGGVHKSSQCYGEYKSIYTESDTYYPKNYLEFSNANQTKKLHPTQKPVALLEYLIKTYTNENDTVLDFTMGSGSTGVACKNLNRDFIGIELDQEYFKIAKERIESTNPLLI